MAQAAERSSDKLSVWRYSKKQGKPCFPPKSDNGIPGSITIHASAVRWGRDNEYKAREAYLLLKSDINTVIGDTRLHLHSEFSFLGASAYGKVIETLPDDSTNIGCLEIKCLFPFLENPSWNPPLNSLQKNIRMCFAWLLLLRMGRSTCERITGTEVR